MLNFDRKCYLIIKYLLKTKLNFDQKTIQKIDRFRKNKDLLERFLKRLNY